MTLFPAKKNDLAQGNMAEKKKFQPHASLCYKFRFGLSFTSRRLNPMMIPNPEAATGSPCPTCP
jgi:hypothetical protein